MPTASLFRNGRNQAVRLPRELEFQGVKEVEVRREGNAIIITPLRKTWRSFATLPNPVDTEFLRKRPAIFTEGRVDFS